MRRSRNCVSLKLASTQISLSERTAIRFWPTWTIIARIDVAARDDAVDLRDDVAVTEIQFGLREIALGGFEFRLGLLHGRGIGRELGERAVDVAQFFELLEHRFRTLVERVHDAELGGTLDEPRLRLEDGRKGFVEIGGHLAEIAAIGLRRQPQRDADLVDFGQGLGEVRASRRQLRLPPVVLLTRHIGPGDKLLRPIEFDLRQHQCGLALVDRGDPRVQQSDLAVDILHGALQVPALAPCLRFDRAHRSGGRLQVRFRSVDRRLLFRDRNLVRLLVQRDEELALAHTVVVIDQNAGDLSRHAGCHERHVPIHVGVVGGDGVEHLLDPRDAEHEENRQDSNTEHAGQKRSLARRLSGHLRRGSRTLAAAARMSRRWQRKHFHPLSVAR